MGDTPTITILGNTYVDIISGFEGICTAKATYLTGCDRSALTPKKLNKDNDGPAEPNWFDDSVLVARTAERVEVDTEPVGASRRTGGPTTNPRGR
jgi:hypothetical protein